MRRLHVLSGPDTARQAHGDLASRFCRVVPAAIPTIPQGAASRGQLVDQALTRTDEGDLVAVVGFTNAVEVASCQLSGHLVLLPDLPGFQGAPYQSVVHAVSQACRSASLVVVAGEAERSVLERLVPGLSGKVSLVDTCGGQVAALWDDPARITAAPTSRRVCVLGEDLRHAGPPSRALFPVRGVSVEMYAWESGAPPAQAVHSAVSEADVVFCDWAGRHAVWAARQVRPDQRLVVRLHGYELGSAWIGELDPDVVEVLVVVSDHWRSRVVESLDWPVDKVRTVPNSVETHDLARPKRPGARFHLGMLGWVPLLKRPDLAVQLLGRILDADPRFVLHLRGDAPWDLDWLWRRRLRERVAYTSLLHEIGRDERLIRAVRFEPYGADVADWFRGIGWVLSLSDTESFHVAAVEGMAAGSVPVVRAREGAADVLGAQFVTEGLDHAAQRIAHTDQVRWEVLSMEAIRQAAQYDVGQTRDLWREVLLGD